MCLAFFGLHPSPSNNNLVFFLAFNRDEFLARPTSAAHWWDSDGQPDVLAGQDLVGKGTWLGTTRSGRIALLTNLREKDVDVLILEHKKHKSRGALVLNFLTSKMSPTEYLSSICIEDEQGDDAYLGFNLVVCDVVGGEMAYLNNTSNRSEQGIRALERGRCYGLSNGLLGQWRKVSSGLDQIELLMEGLTSPDKEFPWAQMLDIMRDQEKDEDLSHASIKEHYHLSSRFIPISWIGGSESGPYGTRTQTLLSVRRGVGGSLVAEQREWTLHESLRSGEEGASVVHNQFALQ